MSAHVHVKATYDQNLYEHVEREIQRAEESRSAAASSAARLRIRAAFGAAQSGVRMLRLAKNEQARRAEGMMGKRKSISMRGTRPSSEGPGGGFARRQSSVQIRTVGMRREAD